jgi:pimeloyl-ACP methyl ester carboxylesterase
VSPRHIRFALLALLTGALVAGAGWFWSTRRVHVARAIVNGHQIEYAVRGTGRPAVVFVMGSYGGGSSRIDSWKPWMAQVDSTAFTYDRPGTGESAPANDQRTPVQIVDELHALLSQVGIPPPYILVGRSLGGLYSRAFAMRYPTEIAGLVLVDGSHERQWIDLHRLDPAKFPEPSPTDPNWKKPDFVGMVETWRTGRLAIDGQLPDVPMAVLTSLHHGSKENPVPAIFEEDWRKLQDEVFQSTTHGMHIVTDRSGHAIANDEPELVWQAIRWVLETARIDGRSGAKKAPN